MEGLQSKVELLLCTCCGPFWIRGPVKRLKCKGAGSCQGVRDRGEGRRGRRGEGRGGQRGRGGGESWESPGKSAGGRGGVRAR